MIIYCIAISFQLVGALILLIFGVSTKRDDIIRNITTTGFTIKDGNKNEINDISELYKTTYKQAYLNRAAFGYLFIGYILGIFGSIKDDIKTKWILFLVVIFLTIILLFASIKTVEFLLSKSPNANNPPTSEDLERLEISPDIETASDADFMSALGISENMRKE